MTKPSVKLPEGARFATNSKPLMDQGLRLNKHLSQNNPVVNLNEKFEKMHGLQESKDGHFLPSSMAD